MTVEIRKDDAPGVYREEVNEAGTRVTPLGTRNVAFVGLFEKGPLNQRIRLRKQEDLISIFGYPNQELYGNDWYAIYDALEESDSCWVIRVSNNPATVGDKMAYSALSVTGGVSTKETIFELSSSEVVGSEKLPSGKGNSNDFILAIEEHTLASDTVLVSAKNVGVDGALIGVKIEGNDKSFTTVTPTWSGTPSTQAIGDIYTVNVGGTDRYFKAIVGGDVDATEPTWNTSVNIGEQYIDADVIWMEVEEDAEKDVLGLRGKYPNTWWKMFKIEISAKKDSSESIFGAPKEEFYFTLDESLAPSGGSLFISDVINGNSSYIYTRIDKLENLVRGTFDPTDYETGLVTIQGLGTGQNGNLTVSNGDYITQSVSAWNLFEHREYVEWNIGFVGADASLDATFQIAKKANALASKRVLGNIYSQCDKVTDVRKEQVVTSSIPAFAGLADPTRMSWYAGHDRRFDPFRGKKIFLPKSIEGLRSRLKTNRILNEFDANAGEEVGVCKGFAQNVEWTKADCGYLYALNINVALTKKKQSVLWGQKTAQRVEEPRDRQNVRTALDKIAVDLEQLGDTLIWKTISPKLIERLYSLFDRDLTAKEGQGFFNTLKGRGYRLTIDSSQASQNKLFVKVEVKIAPTLEWIGITLAVSDDSIEIVES